MHFDLQTHKAFNRKRFLVARGSPSTYCQWINQSVSEMVIVSDFGDNYHLSTELASLFSP